MKQTEANIHKVLEAIRELEKLPAVQAYNALLLALKGYPFPKQDDGGSK